MKKNLKYLSLAVGAAGLTLLSVEPAMAQGLNNVTNVVKSQMPGVAEVLSAVAYVAGVGFGIKAILKLKEHNESKGQVPLSQPITLGIVAGLLLALPTFLQTAKQGVFGAGSKGTTLEGGNIRSIDN
mgnify:CR=1 FL=1|jgi:hypothetical protein